MSETLGGVCVQQSRMEKEEEVCARESERRRDRQTRDEREIRAEGH